MAGTWLLFIETRTFSQKWTRLGLGDEALRALQQAILAGPSRHPVIEGTGGVRKVRFAESGSGRGKSGSYRACYAYFDHHGRVYLLTAYAKAEATDLTAAEKKAMAGLIRAIESELKEEG